MGAEGRRRSPVQKGQYTRPSYSDVKPSLRAAWVELESTRWKPVVDSLKSDGIGWHLATLSMPVGSYLHYNALTVETYPTWASLAAEQDRHTATAWTKANPDMPISQYVALVGNAAERYRVDLLRVEDSGAAK